LSTSQRESHAVPAAYHNSPEFLAAPRSESLLPAHTPIFAKLLANHPNDQFATTSVRDEMNEVTGNPRLAARVLLFDAADRLLLMQARHPRGHLFWIAPGGGLEPDETFEAAAQRELLEETGQSPPLGPCVWTRRHVYEWNGQRYDQAERFFIARTTSSVSEPTSLDGYIVGQRWWSLDEIMASTEIFAPRQLANFLSPLLAGDVPSEPIDCGV
jgi:8-oxo-dGTP pyrophosphatase MutT (NUDIX family)